MIGMIAAAAAALGGGLGYRVGMLRSVVLLLAAAFGAATAWNWGLPAAELLGGSKPAATIALLLVGQIAATALFAWAGLRAVADAAPLPAYFDRAGGVALAAAAAWLAFGAAFAALRAAPAVNDFALRQRGGVSVLESTPDGSWLGLFEHLSARGLEQFPPRPFDAHRYLPQPADAAAR